MVFKKKLRNCQTSEFAKGRQCNIDREETSDFDSLLGA